MKGWGMEMTVWICCVLIVVLLYVLAIHPSCRRAAREAKREVRYYAHRGLYDNNSDAPEILSGRLRLRRRPDTASNWM